MPPPRSVISIPLASFCSVGIIKPLGEHKHRWLLVGHPLGCRISLPCPALLRCTRSSSRSPLELTLSAFPLPHLKPQRHSGPIRMMY